jgi:hypothetical protein
MQLYKTRHVMDFQCPVGEYLKTVTGINGEFVDAIGGVCSGGTGSTKSVQSQGKAFTRECSSGFRSVNSISNRGQLTGIQFTCDKQYNKLQQIGSTFGHDNIQSCPTGSVATGYRTKPFIAEGLANFNLSCGPTSNIKGLELNNTDNSKVNDTTPTPTYVRTLDQRQVATAEVADARIKVDASAEVKRILQLKHPLASLVRIDKIVADSINVPSFTPLVIAAALVYTWYQTR